MGTAVRSGENRALEAAQAAMASPLLEAGAIDGARGILINISGSSSLKLNEVNAASSLIQNAAHEEANIIFGAVLDENMGDEVKITVIATGFQQQAMPERRERMLTVNLREPSTEPVEVTARPVTPKFASEEDDEPAFTPALRREPVLVEEPVIPAPVIEAAEPTAAVAVAEVAPEPNMFEYHEDENGESLEIPAYLRRGGL
jgi:cell division protein FtsZ